MNSTFLILVVSWCLAAFNAAARDSFHGRLEGGIRSLPSSMNLLGTFAWDQELWGQSSQKDPRFGYTSLGVRAGGSPTAAAFVQLSPIAPLILEHQRSFTHRWRDMSYFDCDSLECRSRIDRSDWTVKAAGAAGSWVFLASYLWREAQTIPSNLPVALEAESLIVPSGSHHYTEQSYFIGFNFESAKMLGVAWSTGEVKALNLQTEALYGVGQFKVDPIQVTFGVGTYRNPDERLRGWSSFLALSRSWGDRLGLF